MKKLIAISFILYLSRQYKPGDELPSNNNEMVDAWITAGTAKWEEVPSEDAEEPAPKKKRAKAKPVTAPAGMPGTSIPQTSEDDLAGVVPKH